MKRNSGVLRLLFVAMITVCVAVGVVRAQNAAARIVGTVIDPSGASVPTARITVVNAATQVHYDTEVNEDGYFQAVDLPIGSYNVAVQADGFRTVRYANQVLQINQVLRVDTKLEVGSLTETIEVKDQVDIVETVNPALGASITGRTITDAPLNGRNALDLALLQPGVTPSNPDDITLGTYNIAGGRSDSVTFLLDGGVNNNLLDNSVVYNPNPDTIAEFRILKSGYTAEYGRNGGGIISVVTKSGTNDWHGSVFDFIRNDAFDANSYFNKSNTDPRLNNPRNVLKRHQFGGTFGGPIIIPHLVHGKDRFFFFVGYQGQRQKQNDSVNGAPVFTPLELTGNFSHSGANGFDPNGPDPGVACFLSGLNHNNADATGHPDNTSCGVAPNSFFASTAANAFNAIIDPNKINGISKNYIAAGLIPSADGGILNSQGASQDNREEVTTRFDFNVTEKDRLSVTFGRDKFTKILPFGGSNVPGFTTNWLNTDYFANIAYSRFFSPNFLNQGRITFQRNDTVLATPVSSFSVTPHALGIDITPDLATGPPIISFDKGLLVGFSNQAPSKLIGNTFGYTGTVSWTRGRHSWKFGGEIAAFQFNTVFSFYVNGLFTFTGPGGIGSQNSFADFLLGLPNAFLQGPSAVSNARTKFYVGFVQDEWRINKRLVLTLGLRYEYSTPKLDTAKRTFSLIPGVQSQVFTKAPVGLVFPGDKGAPRGLNFPDKRNWAPRVGFAWDPTGSAKTSIRGGFGIFYDILKAEDNFQFNGQPPFFSSAALSFNPLAADPTGDVPYFANPFTNDVNSTPNPFPSKPPASDVNFTQFGSIGNQPAFVFVDTHLRTPYTYQYNLAVQREVGKNTALEIAYVGSRSHRLTSLIDTNPFILGTLNRPLNLTPGNSNCAEDPNTGIVSGFCSFGGTFTFKNLTQASYHSLETSLTKQLSDSRFFGRTYFMLGYTFAHSIDNTSGFRNRNNSVPSYQPGLFRASSDFDVKHRLVFSGGWDLPFDHAWSSAPKRLTQGWSLFPIVSWRTGFALDIFGQFRNASTSLGPSGAGDIGSVHANLTGQPISIFDPHLVQTLTGPSGTSTGNFYFNPAAFTSAQCAVGSTLTKDPNDPTFCLVNSTTFPSDSQLLLNPSLATYGTLPRNFFRGPGRTNVDLSVAKSTEITERLKLEIRADFFNLFNHAEFSNPETNIASSRFGHVTYTADPRIIQIAARFRF